MIKNKTIDIKISSSNYRKYVDKYGPFKKGDKINIDINDLTMNSAVKITAICELCGVENDVQYYNYNIQIKKGGYYCCKKCGIKKQKDTMIKNETVYYLSNPEYKNKMINLYGVDNPSKMTKIKEKRSNRLSNVEYQQKLLDGIINKYGVDNVSKLESIKEQKKQTCFKNYGVENPSQNEELFFKSQKSGKRIKFHENMKLYYRGTYEKHFLDFCYDNNLSIEKGITINFKYNNKNKVYHSDFFIKEKNLIIEIKSSYYFSKYLELNKIKEIETIKQGYNYVIIIDKNYDNFKIKNSTF